jgi:hypothetical protein
MPALLFNIGRAQELLGDVAGACATYRTAQADDTVRDAATQAITQLNCP